jgi:hypothetical protein
MLKFRGCEGCEIQIDDNGCIVIWQHSYEFGKEVSVVLTPAMAWELQSLINSHHEEMTFAWADGMVQEPPNA